MLHFEIIPNELSQYQDHHVNHYPIRLVLFMAVFGTLYFATGWFSYRRCRNFSLPLSVRDESEGRRREWGEKMRVKKKTRSEQQGEGGGKKRRGERR